MRTAFFGLAGLLLASTSHAASIKYEADVSGYHIVTITGTIVEGDSDQFDRVVAPLSGPTIVGLDSPGGLLVDGLNIGSAIKERGYATAVKAQSVCASVCGLIWLAGSPRYATDASQIGFHAAYRKDGSESGMGNALVGAYLTKLGLSYNAIAYVTDSRPQSMTWLHYDEAERVGIKVTRVNVPQKAIQSQAQGRSPAEQQAVRLVLDYNAYWSQGGANVEGLAQYYAPQVTFYGNAIAREKVMVEKRKFSARWPVRHYTVDQQSLYVQCGNDGCSVAGVVAWDCSSQERGAHSTGSANFALRIVNGAIVSENGSVLNRNVDDAAPQQATTPAPVVPAPVPPTTSETPTTPAYMQGRQARIDYEQWFAGLPEGAFRDGVVYWATHRGDKPQPSCADGSPDQQAGCMAARARLSASDIRRASEKDFWSGWNSL